MNFSNATAVEDGVIISEDFSAQLRELLNWTDANSSDANGIHMPESDTDKTILNIIIITQVLYSLLCLVGLLGNALVIYVVVRFSKMQTVTNLYIVNLAVADECFLIFIPFLITTISTQSWPFGIIISKAYTTATSINQFVNSFFLTVISADLYIAAYHPISAAKIRTPLMSEVVSVAAWTVSSLLVVPVLIYTTAVEHAFCIIMSPDSGPLSGLQVFSPYSIFLGFAVPLLLIAVFCFLVMRKLKTVGSKNKSKEENSHLEDTKLVLTLIAVYVLCWLPYWIIQMALIFTPPHECRSIISFTIFLFVGFLSYSNSAMKPFLYAFLSDNFKKSFLMACTCAASKDVNAKLHMENSTNSCKESSSRLVGNAANY